jgi:arylsulfatase A-like enzyme
VEADDPHYPTPARPGWVRGRFDRVITRAAGVPKDGGPIEADMGDKPRFMRVLTEPRAKARRAMRDGARQRAEAIYVLDREVGRIARELKRTGEWDNTVLMFTSDNGWFLGEHRKRDGKTLGYEPSLRVPFLVTGPGMRSGERRYDPLTLVDVSATILDLADTTRRLSHRHPLDGESKVPALLHGDQGWVTPVITEGHMWNRVDLEVATRWGFHGRGRSYIGIRTARYSLIRTIRGTLELYDLQDDANEMRSRHDDPAYRTRKRELLRVWRAVKDCRGADCRQLLPSDLQADPATERALTTSFWDQVDQVHGY